MLPLDLIRRPYRHKNTGWATASLIAGVLALAAPLHGCSEPDPVTEDLSDIGDMAGPDDMGDIDSALDMNPDEITLEDLQGPGPYEVGFHTFEYEYEVVPGETREIVINVWYPASGTSDEVARYMGSVRDPLSFVDAPLAEIQGPLPVHVHSHGDQGFGGTSARLFRHFVSHGWVVIAPDHTGNLLISNIQPRPIPLYDWRAKDISASLDFAQSLSDHPLADKLKLDAVLLSGHSYGALTTWSLIGKVWNTDYVAERCEAAGNPDHPCTADYLSSFEAGHRDARIVASIPMAGLVSEDWYGNDFSEIDVPVLAMTGTEDQIGQAEQWERVSGVDFTWIDIEGACHQAFALGNCPTAPNEVVDPVINSFTLAFGIRHVLGSQDPVIARVLDGQAEYPIVSFQRKQ